MPDWIGKTIGKVRIEKYLARGGMAEVYLGTHLSLDRQVAVKVMHSFIEEDPDLLMRFQREAKVVAGLRHPNIVQLFDFDTTDGHPYIVMEYLKGPTLGTYLRGLNERHERIPLSQVTRLLNSLSSALEYAHGLGVIHRDIKPGNIILHNKTNDVTPDGVLSNSVDPIITDFGLVRIAQSDTQTATGAVSGTPAYMSPEQARGDKVDKRSDLYSLGVVLYELLAGRVPFEADSTFAVILKQINDPPPPIEGIAAPLQAVIDRALSKSPEQRYQSALELAAEFNNAVLQTSVAKTTISPRLQQPGISAPVLVKPKSNRTPWLIGAAIFVCACLALVLFSGIGFSALTIFSRSTTQPNQTDSYVPSSPGGSADSLGIFRFQNSTSTLDQVSISATLPALSEDTQYEAWLLSPTTEQRRSLGILMPNSSGQFTLSYIDSQNRNLLGAYDSMEITIEKQPDDSPNPSSQVAYSSAIPAGSLMHIRHLLYKYDTTPNQIGMVPGLVNTSSLIKNSADALLAAHNSEDEKSVRENAEAIINLIVGKSNEKEYKDWNGDGQVNDPGDGYGLLINGNQSGYIAGTIDHANLSSDSPDATAQIRMHAEHVSVSAQNMETWTIQIRDIAIRIVSNESPNQEEVDIRTISALSNQLLSGMDINGNEAVDPIPGEAGALTASEHAVYMSDMPILPGEKQVPPAEK